LLNHGTEPPFCGNLTDNKEDGVYACRLCGLPLFKSDEKFSSRSGWASFYDTFDAEHIREIRDVSFGMIRIEIRCARCDGHLGHVFEDGPKPTGLRYCLNSASLEFFANGEEITQKV
jgi:peptide-methionine (R)-S-oxide reductase